MRFIGPKELIVALLGIAVLSIQPAIAAPTNNKFDTSTVVDGTHLQLNGKGTRYRLVVKVYDMALYTTKRVETSADLLALPGAKKLSFVALRDLPGTDLGRLFVRGMSENATSQQLIRQQLTTNRLIEIFSGKSKLNAGDTFAMEFAPGKGTTFFIKDVAQGVPVGDDEFFNLILRIWFGSSPADWKLRDGLLDGGKD